MFCQAERFRTLTKEAMYSILFCIMFHKCCLHVLLVDIIRSLISSNNVIRLDIRKVSEDRGIGDKLKENLEIFRSFVSLYVPIV